MKINETKKIQCIPFLLLRRKLCLRGLTVHIFVKTLTLGTIHMGIIYGLLETHQCVLGGIGMTLGPDLTLQGFLQIAVGVPGGPFLYD